MKNKFYIIFSLLLMTAIASHAQHVRDTEVPDPQEQVTSQKKSAKTSRKQTLRDQVENDKYNIRYERKRKRNNRYYSTLVDYGIKQDKIKLKEDKKKLKKG